MSVAVFLIGNRDKAKNCCALGQDLHVRAAHTDLAVGICSVFFTLDA